MFCRPLRASEGLLLSDPTVCVLLCSGSPRPGGLAHQPPLQPSRRQLERREATSGGTQGSCRQQQRRRQGPRGRRCCWPSSRSASCRCDSLGGAGPSQGSAGGRAAGGTRAGGAEALQPGSEEAGSAATTRNPLICFPICSVPDQKLAACFPCLHSWFENNSSKPYSAAWRSSSVMNRHASLSADNSR